MSIVDAEALHSKEIERRGEKVPCLLREKALQSHYIVFMLHQACRNGHVPDSLCIQTAPQRIKEKSAFTTCNAYDSSQSWTSTNATSTQVLFSQWITNKSDTMFVDSVGLATCLDRVQYFLNPSHLDPYPPHTLLP